ncbi:hypothetical protein BDZ91DRAFT_767722 [Kalaharituber pfeilii]|nr:hypothetical protein BDZ91DRAFT_767722 [Kalaharituber pfeilii]
MAFAVRPPRSALVTGKLRLSGHRASAGTGARAQHGGTVIKRGGRGKELKFSLNWQKGGGLRLENGMGGSREEDLEQKCGLSTELKAEGAHRVFLLKVCLRSPKAVERTAFQLADGSEDCEANGQRLGYQRDELCAQFVHHGVAHSCIAVCRACKDSASPTHSYPGTCGELW